MTKQNLESGNQDVSLGYYGRFETMPIASALSLYIEETTKGREFFANHPDRMQVLNTIADASDPDLALWAQNMSRQDADKEVARKFFMQRAKTARAEARGLLDKGDYHPKIH